MRSLLPAVVMLTTAGCACGPPSTLDAGAADAPDDAIALDDVVDAADAGPSRFLDLDVAATNSCVLLLDRTAHCWGSMLPAGADALVGGIDQISVAAVALCVRRGTSVECLGPPLAGGHPIESPPAGSFSDVSANAHVACGRIEGNATICWGLPPLMLVPATADALRLGGDSIACATDGAVTTCSHIGVAGTEAVIPGPIAYLAAPTWDAHCGLDPAGMVVCDTTCTWEGADPPCDMPGEWTAEVGTGPGGSFVELEMSDRHFMCGLRSDGRIECWGTDYETSSSGPTLRSLEPAAERFSHIGVGLRHVCGTTLDDRVVCWGTDPASIDVPADLR